MTKEIAIIFTVKKVAANKKVCIFFAWLVWFGFILFFKYKGNDGEKERSETGGKEREDGNFQEKILKSESCHK